MLNSSWFAELTLEISTPLFWWRIAWHTSTQTQNYNRYATALGLYGIDAIQEAKTLNSSWFSVLLSGKYHPIVAVTKSYATALGRYSADATQTPSSHLVHVKAHLLRLYVSRTPSPFIALPLACSWSFSVQRCSTLSFKLAYYTAECQVLSLR